MTERSRRVGGVEVLNGDRVEGKDVTRAGLRVLQRRTILSPDVAFGKGVYDDTVKNPNGSIGHRFLTIYPDGAVMVLPVVRRPRASRTILYLGKNLMLYGIGAAEEAGEIEALGSRIGKHRTAEEAATTIVEGKGLRIKELVKVGKTNETSSRQYNWTDKFAALVESKINAKQVEKENLLAVSLTEALWMIRNGIITNDATISAIHLTREYLRMTSSSQGIVRPTTGK